MMANCCDPRTAAVALVRWGFGVMFLVYGIGKLVRHGVTGFPEVLVELFAESWLPSVLVSIFGFVLPFIEVLLGVLLLLGIARNAVLFATALLLILLTLGQAVISQPPVVFQNLTYLFMIAAILFAHRYDRWGLRWGNRDEEIRN